MKVSVQSYVNTVTMLRLRLMQKYISLNPLSLAHFVQYSSFVKGFKHDVTKEKIASLSHALNIVDY